MAEITVAGGTRVGFSANKTLEEAKSLKDNHALLFAKATSYRLMVSAWD